MDREKVRKQMKEYYASSEGYLKHLNKKRGSYFEEYIHFLSHYFKKFKGRRDTKILEVGCGDGYSTHLISKQFPDFKFVGADISPKFIAYAKKHFKNKNLKYKSIDALELASSDGSFDVITSANFIEHLTDVPSFLDQAVNKLGRGGLLIITTSNHFSPIQPMLDILRFEKRPPEAPTYFDQFPLLIKTVWMTFKKMAFEPKFIYTTPDLKNADQGHDFDESYAAHPLDMVHYLKRKNMRLLSIGFQGKTRIRKILGKYFYPISHIGIVAEKK